MTEALVPDCPQSYPWAEDDLRELVSLHQSGADIETLGFYFPATGSQILHELSYLYFGICCPKKGPVGPRHGTIWSPEDDRELDAMYARGVPVPEIAGQLGRSEKAICSRLIEDWRALVTPELIKSLALDEDEFN